MNHQDTTDITATTIGEMPDNTVAVKKDGHITVACLTDAKVDTHTVGGQATAATLTVDLDDTHTGTWAVEHRP